MKRSAEEPLSKDTLKKTNINAKHPTESEEQRKIRKQLQFYFSDSNYPRDDFLLTTAAENDGWIPVDVFLKFNKMKQLGADKDLIVEACRESSYLDVHEQGEMVKRVAPLPENDDFDLRCVYVATPVANRNPDKFFYSIFKEAGVTVKSVWKVKGRPSSYFLEFETVEQANKIVADGDFTYNDKFTGFDCTLETRSKVDYLASPPPMEEPVKKEKKEKKEVKERVVPEFELGCCFKVNGVPSDVNYGQIKKDFLELGMKLVFVDTDKEDHVIMRFDTPKNAEAALTILKDGTFEINSAKYQDVTMMEPEEEQEYRKAVFLASSQRSSQPRRNNNRRGGFRGKNRR